MADSSAEDSAIGHPGRNNLERLGLSELHLAVIAGKNRNVASILAKEDAKELLDARDWEGTTPLMAAVLTGRLAIARLLLQNGASHRAKDCKGRRARDYARPSSFKGKLHVYKRLGLPPISHRQRQKRAQISKILRHSSALKSWFVLVLLSSRSSLPRLCSR